MEEQEHVATFIKKHNLEGTAEFRILDLASEVGEIAKEATESTEYGEFLTTLTWHLMN